MAAGGMREGREEANSPRPGLGLKCKGIEKRLTFYRPKTIISASNRIISTCNASFSCPLLVKEM
jgi:hypothetical protein